MVLLWSEPSRDQRCAFERYERQHEHALHKFDVEHPVRIGHHHQCHFPYGRIVGQKFVVIWDSLFGTSRVSMITLAISSVLPQFHSSHRHRCHFSHGRYSGTENGRDNECVYQQLF